MPGGKHVGVRPLWFDNWNKIQCKFFSSLWPRVRIFLVACSGSILLELVVLVFFALQIMTQWVAVADVGIYISGMYLCQWPEWVASVTSWWKFNSVEPVYMLRVCFFSSSHYKTRITKRLQHQKNCGVLERLASCVVLGALKLMMMALYSCMWEWLQNSMICAFFTPTVPFK